MSRTRLWSAPEHTRFLLVVEPAGFEDFVRTLGEPAQELVIPPPATEPPDIEHLTALAAQYGLEILGPPGIPPEHTRVHGGAEPQLGATAIGAATLRPLTQRGNPGPVAPGRRSPTLQK